MRESLGMVETVGISTAIEVADVMVKAANVKILELENSRGSGYMTVKVTGDVGAVKAAVSAAKASGAKFGNVVSTSVIARPSQGMAKLFCEPEVPYKSVNKKPVSYVESSAKSKGAKAKAQPKAKATQAKKATKASTAKAGDGKTVAKKATSAKAPAKTVQAKAKPEAKVVSKKADAKKPEPKTGATKKPEPKTGATKKPVKTVTKVEAKKVDLKAALKPKPKAKATGASPTAKPKPTSAKSSTAKPTSTKGQTKPKSNPSGTKK